MAALQPFERSTRVGGNGRAAAIPTASEGRLDFLHGGINNAPLCSEAK